LSDSALLCAWESECLWLSFCSREEKDLEKERVECDQWVQRTKRSTIYVLKFQNVTQNNIILVFKTNIHTYIFA